MTYIYTPGKFHREAEHQAKLEEEILNIKTLLDVLETSVENLPERSFSKLYNQNIDIVRNLLDSHGQHVYTDKHAYNISQCRQSFSVWQTEEGLKVHANRCKDRGCPVCQEIRTKQWYHTLKAFEEVMSAPKHIVLTLRSSDTPLEDQLKRLVHSFRRLRQRKIFTNRKAWGYWLIEITYNQKTGLWHPHLHIIANMAYVNQAVIAEAWLEITGDSKIVHVNAIKHDVAKYLCKYVAKASAIFSAPIDINMLYQVMKGKRLVQSFGKFPVKLEKPETLCQFVGSIMHITKKALSGSAYYMAVYQWLMENHPLEMYQSLKGLPLPPILLSSGEISRPKSEEIISETAMSDMLSWASNCAQI